MHPTVNNEKPVSDPMLIEKTEETRKRKEPDPLTEVINSTATKEDAEPLNKKRVIEIGRDGLEESPFFNLANETIIYIFSMLKTTGAINLVCYDFHRLASDTSLARIQALECFREACADALSIGNLKERVEALKHLVSLAHKLGEQASNIVSDCMQAVDQSSIDYYTLCTIALFHIEAGQPNPALEILDRVKDAAKEQGIELSIESFRDKPYRKYFYSSLTEMIRHIAKTDPRTALKKAQELPSPDKERILPEILKSIKDSEILNEGFTILESARYSNKIEKKEHMIVVLGLLAKQLIEKGQRESALEALKKLPKVKFTNEYRTGETFVHRCSTLLQLAELQETLLPEKAEATRLRFLAQMIWLDGKWLTKISLMFTEHLIRLNRFELACDYLKAFFHQYSFEYFTGASKQLCHIIKCCSEKKVKRNAREFLKKLLIQITPLHETLDKELAEEETRTLDPHDYADLYANWWAIYSDLLDQVALLSPKHKHRDNKVSAKQFSWPFQSSFRCRLALTAALEAGALERSQLINKAASLAESMHNHNKSKDTPLSCMMKRAEYVRLLLKIAEVQYTFDPGSATETLVKAFNTVGEQTEKKFIELSMDAIASCALPFPRKILAQIPKSSLFTVKVKANWAEIILNKLVVA